MASEDLYEIRNALALGNHTQVIQEGSAIRSNQYKRADENERLLAERDYLVARAHIANRQYGLAVSDLRSSKVPMHQALVQVAEYLRADGQKDVGAKEMCVREVKDLVMKALEADGEANEGNCMLCVTAAILLTHEMDYGQALEWLKSWATSLSTKAESQKAEQGSSGGINALRLEVHALCVDIFLRLNRVDFAEAEIRQMTKIDDDAALTNLWRGWVALRKQSEEQLREAEGYFMDLKDKFGNTALLLNGIALCYMAQAKWEMAAETLREALSLRDSGEPDTSINLRICRQQLGQQDKGADEEFKKFQMSLSAHSSHPYVRRLTDLERAFDEATQRVM
eukprot:TRINITY_DN914_c4_g1_i1.p1 TRINITY_DN914_c4_g1~~TRINITY_DN914_c4_g1_i1.p1  ORF type:complete len:339 (+),score=127.60 TRINITY_DN914_c4_g1_i1:93-1109(+)